MEDLNPFGQRASKGRADLISRSYVPLGHIFCPVTLSLFPIFSVILNAILQSVYYCIDKTGYGKSVCRKSGHRSLKITRRNHSCHTLSTSVLLSFACFCLLYRYSY